MILSDIPASYQFNNKEVLDQMQAGRHQEIQERQLSIIDKLKTDLSNGLKYSPETLTYVMNSIIELMPTGPVKDPIQQMLEGAEVFGQDGQSKGFLFDVEPTVMIEAEDDRQFPGIGYTGKLYPTRDRVQISGTLNTITGEYKSDILQNSDPDVCDSNTNAYNPKAVS